jgi:hypothetical protein
MTKRKYSSQKAIFYGNYGFVIKIFIIEMDISTSAVSQLRHYIRKQQTNTREQMYKRAKVSFSGAKYM